ncbi:MAG: hypothetical protein ABIH25_02635 [Candidatus Woesearchaeota archaeon]
MVYSDFRYFVEELKSMGVYDVLLPFLLIFTIIFAILEKTLIFGNSGTKENPSPKTNINVIFALLVSAVTIVNKEVIEVINQYLPGVTLIIVIGIMFMLVAAMFSKDGFKGLPFWGGGIIALVAVIWSLSDPTYGAGSTKFGYLYYAIEPYFGLLVAGVLVVIVIFAIVGGGKSKKKGFRLVGD